MKKLLAFVFSVLLLSGMCSLVKSSIGARGVSYIEDKGSSPLPEGAVAVEWIESTGSELIDTGIVIDDENYVLSIDMVRIAQSTVYFNSTGPQISLNILKTGLSSNPNNSNFYVAYLRSNSSYFSAPGYTIFSPDNRTRYELSIGKLVYYRNESVFYTLTFDGALSGEAVDTIKLCGDGTYIKIYSFWISHNGELIINLIPVRIGEEGAMYDTVSGEIYRSIGTGTFIVGPDL